MEWFGDIVRNVVRSCIKRAWIILVISLWFFFFFFGGGAKRLTGSSFPYRRLKLHPGQKKCLVLTTGTPGNSPVIAFVCQMLTTPEEI